MTVCTFTLKSGLSHCGCFIWSMILLKEYVWVENCDCINYITWAPSPFFNDLSEHNWFIKVKCGQLDVFANKYPYFLKGGEIQPVSVKVGDKVLLPEYGGTKVVLDDKVCKLNNFNKLSITLLVFLINGFSVCRIISYLEMVIFLENT